MYSTVWMYVVVFVATAATER